MDIHYFLDQARENLEKASIEARDAETGAQIEALLEGLRNVVPDVSTEWDDEYDNWDDDEDDCLGGFRYTN